MLPSLAILDRAAADAVARQIEDPGRFIAQDPSARVRVAGIEVVSQDRIDARRELLQMYLEDAAQLRQRLDSAGISYLTILPKTAWTNLARESDLFRFTPDKNGYVPADASLLERVGNYAYGVIGARCLAGLSVGAIAGLAAAAALGTQLGLPVYGTVLLCVLGTVLSAFLGGSAIRRLHFTEDAVNPAIVMRLEKARIRKMLGNPKSLLRTLWPHGFVGDKTSPRLKISLPPAPVDAQANLLRASAARFPLTLYAVGEAITFDEDPVYAYERAREPKWGEIAKAHARAVAAQEEDRRRREVERQLFWENLRADPIVATDYESATAIIVQYGDFPIEQELIERVLNSSLLI